MKQKQTRTVYMLTCVLSSFPLILCACHVDMPKVRTHLTYNLKSEVVYFASKKHFEEKHLVIFNVRVKKYSI